MDPIEAPRKGSQRAADLQYDGMTFFVPPSTEGESVAIAGRGDRRLKRTIQKIVQSGKTRYETESDLVRSAVTHFLIDHGQQLSVFTAPEVAQLQRAIERRVETARTWDLVKLCNTTRDALLKMYKVSPERAADQWERYRDEIRGIDPELAKEYEFWFEFDTALHGVKDTINERERAPKTRKITRRK